MSDPSFTSDFNWWARRIVGVILVASAVLLVGAILTWR